VADLTKYDILISNSICDLVRLKSPEGCFEGNKVTPKTDEWYNKMFPFNEFVIYAHINPNDPIDQRNVYCWGNPETPIGKVDPHVVEVQNFKISPKTLLELVKDKKFKSNFFVTKITNLECVIPNMIKRDKILNDGKTFALVKNLEGLDLPSEMKEHLTGFDFKVRGEKFGNTEANLGKVIGIIPDDRYPIRVLFPNGKEFRFVTEDLTYFHEY